MLSVETVQRLLKFRADRDWKQFHTTRNLLSALVIEASELLEIFQWARDAEIAGIVNCEREHIEDELADIATLLAYLCIDLGVNLDSVVQRKLSKNAAKYPVDRSRGTARKYDKL